MKIFKLFFLFFYFPIYAFASCNHSIIDKDPRLACVTVINNYKKTLSVSGYPGFNLNPGLSEETMLLPGAGGLVQISPDPYSPYEEEKTLKCHFSPKTAKEKKIRITYYKNTYEIFPLELKIDILLALKRRGFPRH